MKALFVTNSLYIHTQSQTTSCFVKITSNQQIITRYVLTKYFIFLWKYYRKHACMETKIAGPFKQLWCYGILWNVNFMSLSTGGICDQPVLTTPKEKILSFVPLCFLQFTTTGFDLLEPRLQFQNLQWCNTLPDFFTHLISINIESYTYLQQIATQIFTKIQSFLLKGTSACN